MSRYWLILLVVLMVSGCASAPPFPDSALRSVKRSLTPEQAIKSEARDVKVLWGGVIIGSVNMPEHTDFNVLFYPLNGAQRPDLDRSPQHRYIVRYPGYLETMVYAPGREITVLGDLQGLEKGKVDNAVYHFPVLRAEKIHLWPVRSDSKVRFGIGVGIGIHR